ncbi:MAG: 23S rRNA (uracil(1939)-C(5))-methyltransferase RlmD [Eggerthella lenta]
MAELFADVADASALRPILGMDEPYYYRNKVVSPYAPGRKLQGSANARAGKGATRAAAATASAPRSRAARSSAACTRPDRTASSPPTAVSSRTKRPSASSALIRDLMPRFSIEPYREDSGTGFLRHAVVRVGHTSGEILVTLVTNGRAFPASRAFCRELVRRCPRITSVVQNVNERQTNVILGEREQTLYGPGFILDKLCGLSFRISSQSFYQVNAVQTEVLYERAIDLAGFTGSETAIDAYCGTGTIGLVAAKRGARQVIGVDTVASAVRDARENAKHNGVENARFAVGDAGAFMRERAAAGDAVDVLLMDPPRAGSSEEFLAAAVTLAPRRIVYISCNPTTQVRDLAFLRQRGYAVRTVQPVDMFPHTDHIETIALVERVEGFFERSDR